MIIIMFALLIIIPIIIWATTQTNDNTRVAQAQAAVDKIARAADEVYSQGPDSQTQIKVYFPSGIDSTYIQSKTIGINLPISSGTTDIYAETKSPLKEPESLIPTRSGLQVITIRMNVDGYVYIS